MSVPILYSRDPYSGGLKGTVSIEVDDYGALVAAVRVDYDNDAVVLRSVELLLESALRLVRRENESALSRS